MDVHVKRAVTDGLRLRGVDVMTAQEDGAAEFEDSALLDRATELGRVLFSQDDDPFARGKQTTANRRTFRRCHLRTPT